MKKLTILAALKQLKSHFWLLFSSSAALCLFLSPSVTSLLLIAFIFLWVVIVSLLNLVPPPNRHPNSNLEIIACFITLIIQFEAFISFKTAWSTSGKVGMVANYFNLTPFILLTIVGLIGVVLGFYAINVFSLWAIIGIKSLFKLLEKDKVTNKFSQYKKPFLVLFIMYLVATSGIIMTDVSYIDDMGRIARGYSGWDNFSRYTSNFLSHLLHTNLYLADISPLTQVIAVILITVASLIVIIVFSENTKITFWSLVAVLPLGISPYFLECLSYKYDSPYMAVSVLASVVPLLFYQQNLTVYILTILLGILLTCTTYQAALGIFPIAILILSFLHWEQGVPKGKIIKFIVSSAIGYLGAMVIYKIFIMKPVDTYVSSEMYALSEMPKGILSNIKRYLALVYSDFEGLWLILLAIILCTFVVLSVFRSKRNKYLTTMLAITIILFSACLCFGPYIAMKSPLYACRAMYGFGAFIAIFAVSCVGSNNLLKSQNRVYTSTLCLAKIACLFLSWCFLVFSFVYANALDEQQRYKDFRTEMVLRALDQILVPNTEQPVNIQIIGSAGNSPVVERMPQYNSVLRRLVSAVRFAGDGWMWSVYDFENYYDLEFFEVDNLQELKLPILYDGYYETIYGDENNILIELHPY